MIATSHPLSPAPMSFRGFRRPVASVTPVVVDSSHAPHLRRWLGYQASRYSDLLQNIEAVSRLRRASVITSR